MLSNPTSARTSKCKRETKCKRGTFDRLLYATIACAVSFVIGGLLPRAWELSPIKFAHASSTQGEWSGVQSWPVLPIHATLSPTGKLLTFGAAAPPDSSTGRGEKRYDTYDPGSGLHDTVFQDTHDYFCSATVIVPTSSDILIAGGDDFEPGSIGNSLASLYDPDSQRVSDGPQMAAPRWYPTVTTLPNGEILVQGGRGVDNSDAISTVEIYNASSGWRELPGAESADRYARNGLEWRWWYPRAWVDGSGGVFTIAQSRMFTINTQGQGSVVEHGTLPQGYRGGATSSSVMYAPGLILQAGGGATNNAMDRPGLSTAAIIDIRSGVPQVTPIANMNFPRHWADATVLPNGQVLVNGGSGTNNALVDVAFPSEIWDPQTQDWTVVDSEARERLYHSSSVLLPDGRVFSGGGGSPGPVTHLDAQFFTPPYLFDSGGSLATRPVIQTAPTDIAWNSEFSIRPSSLADVDRVTLVKTGATTHSFNNDQRFMELDFDIDGNQVTVTAPANANVATPGYYLLSIVNGDGVVSESKMVSLLTDTPTSGGGVGVGGGGTTETYEDAEDRNTNGWVVYDNNPTGASVSNVFDSGAGSRVIALSGAGRSNGYRLGGTGPGNGGWNDSDGTVLSWRMNTPGSYAVYVAVRTTQGFRYLLYRDTTVTALNGIYLEHGLGASSVGGGWQTHTRDLASDVRSLEPGNRLESVQGFLVRGSLRVDDIELGDGSGAGGGGGAMNTPPNANAGADRDAIRGVSVNLNGSGSSDSDGTIEAFRWTDSTGAVLSNNANFNWTPTTVGNQTLTLRVTDDDGATDTDTVQIDVAAPSVGGGGTTETYEDAEDRNTNGWVVYDNNPTGASVSNVFDSGAGSRVIALSGAGRSNGYRLGGTGPGNGGWNDSDGTVLSWRMNTPGSYAVYVAVRTTQGFRYLLYRDTTVTALNGIYLEHGLGASSVGGGWQTHTRDLASDVRSLEPGNRLESVQGFLVRGSLRVDDIELGD